MQNDLKNTWGEIKSPHLNPKTPTPKHRLGCRYTSCWSARSWRASSQVTSLTLSPFEGSRTVAVLSVTEGERGSQEKVSSSVTSLSFPSNIIRCTGSPKGSALPLK